MVILCVFYILTNTNNVFAYFVILYSVGESVDDCGGGYSESVAEMCDELQNGSLPLLVLTPNGRDDAGTNKDCFLLNPAAKSSLHMEMFRFLGNFHVLSPTDF